MPPVDSQPTTTSVPATVTATPPRRTWPVTAAAVLLGWCLIAWTLFVGVINTAPFFGEIPSRDEHVESGLVALTALAPLAILVVLALRWGSRWGILLLVVPTVLLAPLGLDWASRTGSDRDPDPTRPLRAGDLVGELTHVNWAISALLLAVLVASLLRGRRARRTVPGGGRGAP